MLTYVQVGGKDCRLIVYPRGQSQPPQHLSLFLEVTDPRNGDTDWSCFVSHRLSVVHQVRVALRYCILFGLFGPRVHTQVDASCPTATVQVTTLYDLPVQPQRRIASDHMCLRTCVSMCMRVPSLIDAMSHVACWLIYCITPPRNINSEATS